MKFMQNITPFIVLNVICGTASAQVPESAFNKDPWPMHEQGPVKVYILCGQSNMQGHASLRTLEYLIYNQETAADYQQWKTYMGGWAERSDVWIWTTDGERYGKLKPGYGQNEMKLGPELGFGWIMGEQMNEQVLIIKTCWGGRSVKKDFLPPSAEMPSETALGQELERAQKNKPNITLANIKSAYGQAYRDTIKHTKDVLRNLKQFFPQYNDKRGYELAGFVFFQGWNDYVDREQRNEKFASYTERLATMISDIRRDLNVPGLPVVIGELGASKRGDFQTAQGAVLNQPGINNVAFVRTRDFWEPNVEAMTNQKAWENKDWFKFYNVASNRGYHYLGSARIMVSIGDAFGKAMLELHKP